MRGGCYHIDKEGQKKLSKVESDSSRLAVEKFIIEESVGEKLII